MSATIYRKTIHLQPDNPDEADRNLCRSVVGFNRNSIHLLNISDRQKAVSLMRWEFPFATDDLTWAEHLQEVLDDPELVGSQSDRVQYWYDGEPAMVIPRAMHDPNRSNELFAFLHGSTDGMTVHEQPLSTIDAVGLWILPQTVAQQLSNPVKNAHVAWLEQRISEPAATASAFLCMAEQHFFLAITESGKLTFSNRFNHSGPEDVLYFLMATLESRNILHSEVILHLSGSVGKGDPVYTVLTRFLASTRFDKRPRNLSYAYSFQQLPEHDLPFLFAAACA